MKLSDYVVKIIKEYDCTDVFGYQGGMISHLADSLSKDPNIAVHTLLHEQSCAFAACAYSQASGRTGWVYTSSGPGATNLITGICNAYYDSIPVIFFTGQVNTNESKGSLRVRQKAFQETDVVSIVKNITKAAFYVDDPLSIKYYIKKAVHIANSGRKGPVVIDLPMNIQRAEIVEEELRDYFSDAEFSSAIDSADIMNLLSDSIKKAQRPVLILGNGFNISNKHDEAETLVNLLQIPTVTSMIAKDLLGESCPYYYGFLGAYGHRVANFIVAKSDLIIAIGTRLDVRQIGGIKENFAPNAKLLRFDIDEYELENKIKEDEIQVKCDIATLVSELKKWIRNGNHREWINVCGIIKTKLQRYDQTSQKTFISRLSSNISENAIITTDVGQNQVWVAQAFKTKRGQRILFSGGHGSMGYSLPASIGAYYATKRPVVCFCGDGGLQMSIQELQIVKEYKLPIAIIVLNNYCLGMIRYFQKMYFDGRFAQTTREYGYSIPSFTKIAEAYGIKAFSYSDVDDEIFFDDVEWPILVNVDLDEQSIIEPKLEFGKPNQDQEPLIDRSLYNELMEL